MLFFIILLLIQQTLYAYTAFVNGQLSFRPNEATQDWFFQDGVLDSPVLYYINKPKLDWRLIFMTNTVYSTRQYASTNYLSPTLLWPIQEQLYLGGDAFAQPTTSFSYVNPKFNLTISHLKFKKLDGILFYSTEFGNISTIAGVMAYESAYLKLFHSKHELLIGQTTSPCIAEKYIPLCLGFNNISPIVPALSLTGQIRYRYTDLNKSLQTTLYTNGLIKDSGPEGFNEIYQRSSCQPGINILGSYHDNNLDVDIGIDTRLILPYQVNIASSYSDPLSPFNAYNKTIRFTNAFINCLYQFHKTSLRAQIIGGQNGNNLYLLGGYGISTFKKNYTESDISYTAIPFISSWVDVNQSIYKNINLGLFVGYSKMFRTQNSLQPLKENQDKPVIYSLDDVYDNELYDPKKLMTEQLRISTRWTLNLFDHMTIGGEVMFIQSGFSSIAPSGYFPIDYKKSIIRYTLQSLLSL